MQEKDSHCPNCGIDLQEVFGRAGDRPKPRTFICAETAEIVTVEIGPYDAERGRCTCGADILAPAL